MKKIDRSVISAISEIGEDDNKSLKVLVACIEDCAELVEELGEAGANVEQEISELNILLVSIKAEHLSVLEASDNVDSVELDEDIQIQSN